MNEWSRQRNAATVAKPGWWKPFAAWCAVLVVGLIVAWTFMMRFVWITAAVFDAALVTPTTPVSLRSVGWSTRFDTAHGPTKPANFQPLLQSRRGDSNPRPLHYERVWGSFRDTPKTRIFLEIVSTPDYG